MKQHVYKVLFIDGDNEPSLYDDIVNTNVMNEKELRDEFLWAFNNNKIPMELLSDYMADRDYMDEDWNDMGNLRAGTMVDMLNDLSNYGCADCYIITETDLTIGE